MTGNGDPQLPFGEPSILQGIGENFSFHASPESFIQSRIAELRKRRPDLLSSRGIVRAKILNRNVAIVSSYSQIMQVLCHDDPEDSRYVASSAYDELMAPFFPGPNLLLSDGVAHHEMRAPWEQNTISFCNRIKLLAETIANKHFERLVDNPAFDLYSSMKSLAWQILLKTFLGLNFSDPDFLIVKSLQDDLLRGQFSLFPVSINVGFWASPRKRGITARKKLQEIISKRLRIGVDICPFSTTGEVRPGFDTNGVADHLLMFTSSLAAKSLASLLTAFLLNLCIYQDINGAACINQLYKLSEDVMNYKLHSILLETERLSPPIVGVMRRSTKNNTITGQDEQSDTLIPEGWDVWCYLAGASRDSKTFGSTHDRFLPDRYEQNDIARPLAFSIGNKACLGQKLMHECAVAVAKTFVQSKYNLTGATPATGVQQWLGWSAAIDSNYSAWAADMKQLPTQRPINPVLVKLVRAEPRFT